MQDLVVVKDIKDSSRSLHSSSIVQPTPDDARSRIPSYNNKYTVTDLFCKSNTRGRDILGMAQINCRHCMSDCELCLIHSILVHEIVALTLCPFKLQGPLTMPDRGKLHPEI
jgi:hypothetical protein